MPTLIDPLIEAGRLPNLARWMGRGCARRLRSTVPPMSFPAWTTFLTGVEPGVHGATDELGAQAVDLVHPIRDFHVTLLHLLGLDDNKLTYFHAGRYKQLSQFGGQVITDLLA